MSEPSTLIQVGLSEDDVKCLAGVVAQLQIAVKETKVIQVDEERLSRLQQAQFIVDKWKRVVAIRGDLARAEREARGE